MGKLRVMVDYHPRHNFSLEVTIRELGLRVPITFEGKIFDLPEGRYTVALKGLMSDPDYGGAYHHVYKDVYGWFERKKKVEVREDQEATCAFELPGEQLPVRIHVVAADAPIVGAEVLIKEVDPNFRATRMHAGAAFFLKPGSYSVVVAHENALMKETIHVTDRETEFIMDISRQVALRPRLVVVRYRDGRMVKGITEDFTPATPKFTVMQGDMHRHTIEDFAEIKAVFFVKSLEGNPLYDEQKDFAVASQFGRKTVVVFRDKEELFGYTLAGHAQHPQFFLFPVDPKSNNAKVYVVREAVSEIRFA
jgi:hypothetical protein